MIGYTFKRLNIIKEDDGDGISRIVFNITLPALIINTFNSMKLDSSLMFLSIISIIFGIIMSIIGVFVFKDETKIIRGTLAMLVPGFNIGLFAYPLVQSIWGINGIKYFGMFDMGNSITIFIFCYLIANHFSSNNESVNYKDILKKLLTSLPLMSYVVTLAINFSGYHYPVAVTNVCSILSKANMPLSLLLLGIYLNFTIDKMYRKNALKILALRYGIGLACGIILFIIIPFDNLFRYTLLIGLLLPIGMADIPYAVEFNYDKRLVGTLCNITMIISFILIWGIVALAPA